MSKKSILAFFTITLFTIFGSGCVLQDFSFFSGNSNANTNTDYSQIVLEQKWPYTWPENIYPEQVSSVLEKDGALYALVNIMNKYSNEAAVLKYGLNPNPEIIDTYKFLGVLKSVDNGNSWTEFYKYDYDVDHEELRSIDTCAESNGGGVVYLFFKSGRTSGGHATNGAMHIYYSEDGGTNFASQGIFALKRGNELDIISAINKNPADLDTMPLEILVNFEAEDGACGNVSFNYENGADVVSSGNYGTSWTRVKKQ